MRRIAWIPLLLVITACEKVETYGGKRATLEGCLVAIEEVARRTTGSVGKIQFTTNTPEMVSGRIGPYYFHCQRKASGTHGVYWEGLFVPK